MSLCCFPLQGASGPRPILRAITARKHAMLHAHALKKARSWSMPMVQLLMPGWST